MRDLVDDIIGLPVYTIFGYNVLGIHDYKILRIIKEFNDRNIS